MATHLELSRLIFKYFLFKECVSVLQLSVFARYLFISFAIFVKFAKFNLCFHIDSDFKKSKYLSFRFIMIMFYKCKQF